MRKFLIGVFIVSAVVAVAIGLWFVFHHHNPTIASEPPSFTFTATEGGLNPSSQTLGIWNSGGETLTWAVSDNATWLNLNPTSGSSRSETDNVTVSVDILGMAAGSYNAIITISAPGATNTPQMVSVGLTINPAPTIGYSPSSFGFSATEAGANPPSQTLSIWNSKGGTLNWSVSHDADWLSLNPTNGTSAGEHDGVTVSVNISGMTPGSYNATITISAPGATNTPKTASVNLTINPQPTIARSPSRFSFTATKGGANPSDQTLEIWNSGVDTLNWSVSDNATWLSLNPTTGSSTGETDSLTVSANITGMAAGDYSANITISAPGGSNTPQTVPVTLTIIVEPALPTLSVHFIDVGQGDSILIDLGETEVLIDGGGKSPGVVDYLHNYVNGTLEVMVATHPDADHIGGLIAVLDSFNVTQIWLNGDTGNSTTYAQFMAAVNSEGAQLHNATRGDQIEAGSLTFTVLNPVDLSGLTNDNSIVLNLTYGAVDFLFTGDAEEGAEASMLEAGKVPSAEILKVGHHGSRTASSEAFLEKVRPEVAIIMVGEGNQYGHPHNETIDRLNEIGAQIYRTDVNGTILVTTDGATYSVYTENDEAQLPVAAASNNSPVCEGDTIELYGGPDGMANYSWVGPNGWTSNVQNPTRPDASLAMAGDYNLTITDANGHSDSDTINVAVSACPIGVSNVQITYIFYDGLVYRVESDEYVEITNLGDASQDLEGWVLKDISEGYPSFTFPSYALDPGESIRVYTNEYHPESGGFSFGYGKAIWSNSEPDVAALYNAQGQVVSTKSY